MKTLSTKLSKFIFYAALILVIVLLLVGFVGESVSKFPLFLAIGVVTCLVAFMALQIFNRAKEGEAAKIILRLLEKTVVFFILFFCYNLAFDKDVLHKVGATCFSAALAALLVAIVSIWDEVLKSSKDS